MQCHKLVLFILFLCNVICIILFLCSVIFISFYTVPMQCHMYRGVHPLKYEKPLSPSWPVDMEERFIAGIDKGRKIGAIKNGSAVVCLSGWKPGPANTNTLRIFTVSD